MSKNILVLTGSPRVGGNSDLLADAFIKGAQAGGHHVIKYPAAFRDLKCCKACDRCFQNNRPCAEDEEFCALAPEIEKADLLVFVTPSYWSAFPAQLKIAVDKFYAFLIGGRSLSGKDSMLIVCGEFPEEKAFSTIVDTYKDIASYEGWNNKGVLIVPGVNCKGDVAGSKKLEKAEFMGRWC